MRGKFERKAQGRRRADWMAHDGVSAIYSWAKQKIERARLIGGSGL